MLEKAMKRVFGRLCLACFCIVLAAFPIGAIELYYLNAPGSTFLGCEVGELGDIGCNSGTLDGVKEIILNLPFGFVIAPIFRPSVLNPVGPAQWRLFLQPLVIYLYTLDLILVLAIVHVVRLIIGVIKRLRRRSRWS
jgi:hypothetical protein